MSIRERGEREKKKEKETKKMKERKKERWKLRGERKRSQ